jgi:DNA-binding LacI/PurR family transcriptional regulator
MKTQRTSAQDAATAYLQRLVAQCRDANTHRLPTVHTLAAAAHVGPVAMLKAVQALVAGGVLIARPRLGIIIADSRAAATIALHNAAGPGDQVLAWERVHRRFQTDLLTGAYPAGERCPSMKELAERYGTSYQSLRRAIARLIAEKALLPHRKGYRPVSQIATRPGSSIVLIARADPGGSLNVAFPRTAESLRLLESECYRRNLGLQVSALPGENDRTRFPPSLPRGRDVLGYVLFSEDISPPSVESLSLRLAARGTPVAVFDDSSGLRLTPAAVSPIRVFRATDTQTASRRIGRYLLQLGHRRVAYVSPTHGALWSQERLAGLRAAFSEAGVADGVVPITHDLIERTAQALGEGHTTRDVVEQACATLRRSGSPYCRMVRSMLERVEHQLFVLMEPELFADIEHTLFEKALTATQATAWVTSSDYVASRALAFLGARGVDVPGQVSVVGFDDSTEAFVHGITSYNFDMQSLVRAMIGHTLNPAAAPATGMRGTVVEIEGFITERKTTAKPAV